MNDDLFGEMTVPTETIPSPGTPVATKPAGNNEWKKDKEPSFYDRNDFKAVKIDRQNFKVADKEILMVVNDDIDNDNFDFIVKVCVGLIEKGFTIRTTLGANDCKINDIVRKINDKDAIINYIPYKGFDKKIKVEHKESKFPNEDCYNVAAGLNTKFFNEGSPAARSFQSRTAHAVLGDDCKTPASFLLCFSTDGADDYKSVSWKKTGNLNGYVRTTSLAGLPVFNLGNNAAKNRLVEYIKSTVNNNNNNGDV